MLQALKGKMWKEFCILTYSRFRYAKVYNLNKDTTRPTCTYTVLLSQIHQTYIQHRPGLLIINKCLNAMYPITPHSLITIKDRLRNKPSHNKGNSISSHSKDHRTNLNRDNNRNKGHSRLNPNKDSNPCNNIRLRLNKEVHHRVEAMAGQTTANKKEAAKHSLFFYIKPGTLLLRCPA
jgi:hypothetical protein